MKRFQLKRPSRSMINYRENVLKKNNYLFIYHSNKPLLLGSERSSSKRTDGPKNFGWSENIVIFQQVYWEPFAASVLEPKYSDKIIPLWTGHSPHNDNIWIFWSELTEELAINHFWENEKCPEEGWQTVVKFKLEQRAKTVYIRIDICS